MFREIWKPIPGYEGLYQVSNLGRVKSLNYRHTGKEGILSPGKNTQGYYHVILAKNGKHKIFRVHRLVYEAFNGPIPDGMQINHNDEVKTNNNLENLSLVTCKENINWGTRNERMINNRTGERSPKWVVKLSKNDEILHFYPSANQATRETGIRQSGITDCCRGKSKTSGGFKWKYAE